MIPRETGVTEMIRTSPSRGHTYKRKDWTLGCVNITRETPVNLWVQTLRI